MFTKKKIKKLKDHIGQYIEEGNNYLFFFIDWEGNSQYQMKWRKRWEEIKFNELGIFSDDIKKIKCVKQNIESWEKEEFEIEPIKLKWLF